MATAAQVLANQANAQNSTDTCMKAGKSALARHSLSEGGSKSFVILPGQEAEFETFERNLRAEFQPQGIYQDILFKQILHASWNLERCAKAEAQLHSESADPNLDPLLVEANAGKLRLIALYAGRAERSLYRASRELRQVQTEARYRVEESQSREHISPLVNTQSIDKQSASNIAKLQQAALNQVRALMEAPNPGEFAGKTGPENVPGQTKPMSMADLLVMKVGGTL